MAEREPETIRMDWEHNELERYVVYALPAGFTETVNCL